MEVCERSTYVKGMQGFSYQDCLLFLSSLNVSLILETKGILNDIVGNNVGAKKNAPSHLVCDKRKNRDFGPGKN